MNLRRFAWLLAACGAIGALVSSACTSTSDSGDGHARDPDGVRDSADERDGGIAGNNGPVEAGTRDDDASADALAARLLPASALRDHMNGTRLRARFWIGDEGPPIRQVALPEPRAQIWQDTQLGAPCMFRDLEDTLVCVPIASYGDPAVASFPGFGFVASDCTGARVATLATDSRDADSCGSKRYAHLIRQGASRIDIGSYSFIGSDVFEIAGPLDADAWYAKGLRTDAVCTAVATASSGRVYRIGNRLGPDDLVRGHVERVTTGRRLDEIAIVAEDGARQRIGWHDRAVGADCEVREGRDGSWRCFPASVDSILFLPSRYGDAECKRAVAAIPSNAPANVRFARAPSNAPTVGQRYYQSLDRGASSYSYFRFEKVEKLYERADGSCVVLNEHPTEFVTYEEVALDVFDTFEAATIDGPRLALDARSDVEGTVEIYPLRVVDRKRQSACGIEPTEDGAWRCLPVDALVWRYGDANCSADQAFVHVPNGSPKPLWARAWKGDECAGGWSTFQVGDVVPRRPTNVDDTDAHGRGCARSTFGTGLASTQTFYSIGPPALTSGFVGVTLSID